MFLNMRALSQKILQLIVLKSCIFTLTFAQSRELITEKAEVSYCDKRFVDVDAGVFTNDKNEVAFKGSILMKIDLPIDTKMSFKSYRIINGKEYRFLFIERRLKEILEMDSFDLQGLFVRNAVPPITWPVKKEVLHRIRGWVPDKSKYPSTMPTGRWLAQMTEILPNKTTTFSINWYFKTT